MQNVAVSVNIFCVTMFFEMTKHVSIVEQNE